MLRAICLDPRPNVRQLAGDGEVKGAHAILSEASRWMRQKGVRAWSADEIACSGLAERSGSGELFGGFSGADLRATMQVHAHDPIYWPEDPVGEALYVHKVAVARNAAGLGWPAFMLQYAASLANAREARFIRLDTLAGPLVGYYASLGFICRPEPPRIFDSRPVVRLERSV